MLFVRDVGRAALVEAIRVGIPLGVGVAVLAILGLAPSMSWIPEAPLLAVAGLLPLIAYGLAGHRAARRSGRMLAGAIAGGVVGAMSGGVAGVAYMIFGKAALNVAVGLLVGAFGGAIIGAAAAFVSRRTARR
jgi:hypothetical protein